MYEIEIRLSIIIHIFFKSSLKSWSVYRLRMSYIAIHCIKLISHALIISIWIHEQISNEWILTMMDSLKKTDGICCKPFAYHFLNRKCNFDRCTTNNSLSLPKQNSMKRYKWKWSVEKWDKSLFLWCFACIESSSFFEIKRNWN